MLTYAFGRLRDQDGIADWIPTQGSSGVLQLDMHSPGLSALNQGLAQATPTTDLEDENRVCGTSLEPDTQWPGELTSERLGIPGLSTRPYILQGRGCATEAMLVVYSIVHISGHKSRLLWNVPEQMMSWFQNLYRT